MSQRCEQTNPATAADIPVSGLWGDERLAIFAADDVPTLFAIGAEDLGTHEAWIIGWGISFPGSTRVVATDDGHTVSTVRPEDSLRFFAEGGQTRLSLIYAPSIRDALQYRVHRPAESPVEGPAGNRAST